MAGPELLRLEGVSAGYGAHLVVEDVSLSVSGGEVVGLIGPNGSGKTTLVRVASRALRPRAGRVSVAGEDPYALPAAEAARRVAVVPQGIQTFFPFTVLELILMGRATRRSGATEDYGRARAAAETAHVHHLADRTLDELSGGERQRVLLAQALAQDAPVLLLDEPTTHLDPHHVVAILDVIRSLARRDGRAVLAIFHDLTLASAYCDRLLALSNGRVAASGSPDLVVTKELLREVYDVEGDVMTNALTGRPAVLLRPAMEPAGKVGRAHVMGGAGRGAPVMRLLAELGFHVTAGVLHATDTDADVAERLNLDRVVVPPFSTIDASAELAVSEMLGSADIVVVCDAPYGTANLANLRIAEEAVRAGTRTILLGNASIEDRDFTGGEASRLWRSMSQRCERVPRYEELRDALVG